MFTARSAGAPPLPCICPGRNAKRLRTLNVSADKDEAESDKSHANATVLLVEDDEEVAALAADMIDQLGYQVIRVANAAAALGALANGRNIDIVFSDILMPGGMSGADLAGEIVRRRPGLPVILATGYDGQSLTAAEKLGLPMLRKPYRLNELSRALAMALTSSQRPEISH